MTATEGSPDAEFEVTLPFGPDAARVARTMVGRLLTEQSCGPQLVEDSRLVVHELVMNGITHGSADAQTEIAVACRVLREHVVISVLDQGHHGTVAVSPSSADRIDGRGLAIVEALSERWSVDRTGGTKVEAWLAR